MVRAADAGATAVPRKRDARDTTVVDEAERSDDTLDETTVVSEGDE